MESGAFTHGEKRFSSPQEELDYLRQQVAVREKEMMAKGAEIQKQNIIADKVKDYSYTAPSAMLTEQYQLPKQEVESIALNLTPEAHDAKISELFQIMKEKGIKNAMSVVDAMNDPHVEDDFHRFLVQYLKKAHEVPGLKPKSELWRELDMTLYEVSMPDEKQETEKTLKEIVSAMEQFYAGMLSVGDKNDPDRYFTLEIANPNHSEEFIFYVSVPDTKKDLFEKQVVSLFHNVKIREVADDYNIFNEAGVTIGSVAVQDKNPIFPLKTYDEFDHDPLNVILNAFSKIKKDGEGAAMQVVFRPTSEDYSKKYKHSLDEILKGVSVKKALPKSVLGEFWWSVKDILGSKESYDKDEKKEDKPVDEMVVENIKKKIASPMCEVVVRVIASSNTEAESLKIISDIESGLNQLDSPGSNRIKWKRLTGTKLQAMAKDFSFRAFNSSDMMPLNFRELTTIMHFPGITVHTTPQLKQAQAAQAAAPMGLPQEGTLLGVNKYRNMQTNVFMTKEDRLRHFYTIGQTGTGKSTLLKNMIAQDILQGEGVCMIDPHGVDIMDILAIIPKERYDDLIYFDPGYTDRPMALNMLEYDIRYPEQKTFVVNELLGIFNKLFDMKTAGGPMFEQYFRNATMLVIEDPESGNTLLEISRVLASKPFRELKLSRCKNPIVVQFWREVAEKAGGEASLANIVPYITSKFDGFLSNEIMRPIIAQEHSSFNFREIMDKKKILLVNLSKGRLGDLNANLIGLILVGKILMAALSRADSLHLNPPPFYLYIDEFQNVTTDSISSILSEARKYKLSLNVAHQFIAQLDEKIRDSVFGNVGNIATFRVGADDAEYLEKQFAPVFTASDIINIENRNAYLKILVNGKPVKPFNIETLPPPKGNKDIVDKLKKLSYLTYGKDRAQVEAVIMEKYKKAPAPSPAPVPPTPTPAPAPSTSSGQVAPPKPSL